MAELVDALVSNTSAARHAGSIPALGTIYTLLTPCKSMIYKGFYFFLRRKWSANLAKESEKLDMLSNGRSTISMDEPCFH